MVKRLLSILVALALVAIPLASTGERALAAPIGETAYAAEPAYAANLIETLKSKLSGVGEWASSVWDAGKCVTDLDCLMFNSFMSILNHFWSWLVGVPGFDGMEGDDLVAMMQGKWNTGLAFAAAGAIDGVYNDSPGLKELHFASYIKRELSDNLLNQRAYATTAGEALIGPLEGAWRAVRRFAYGLSLVVMVVIGFMIMFQKQLPARTVLTFTSALPRILLSLVLITFSFSIVALVFDVVGVLGSTIAFEALKNEDTSSYMESLTAPVEEVTTGGLSGTTLGSAAGMFIGNYLVAILQPLVESESIDDTARTALQALFSGTFFLVALVVALIAIAIQVCYRSVKLIIGAVFAPLIFLIGSLPGQEGVSNSFILGLVADCAAFPAIAFMFSLSFLFLMNAVETLTLPTAGIDAFTAISLMRSSVMNGMISLVLLIMTFVAPGKIAGVLKGSPKKR